MFIMLVKAVPRTCSELRDTTRDLTKAALLSVHEVDEFYIARSTPSSSNMFNMFIMLV